MGLMARYVLLVLGALLIWITDLMGAPSDTAEKFDRVRAEGERAPAVVTRIDEREVTQRRRRGSSTRTVFCPEVTYRDGGRERSFVEYDDCDRWEVGDETTVVWDPDEPYNAHLDTDRVRDALAGDERSYSWGRWGGLFLVVSCSIVILLGWYRRIRRRLGRRRI